MRRRDINAGKSGLTGLVIEQLVHYGWSIIRTRHVPFGVLVSRPGQVGLPTGVCLAPFRSQLWGGELKE